MLENEYRHNKKFREYVDKYCKNMKVTVEETLQHEIVRQVFLMYTDKAERTKVKMGRKKDGLLEFHREAARKGITYAEAQKRETQEQIERIRVPQTEGQDGPLYMKVSARNRIKKLEVETEGVK